MVQIQFSLAVTISAASSQLAVRLLPYLFSGAHHICFHATAPRLRTNSSSFSLSPHPPCFHGTSKPAQHHFIPAHLSVLICIHLCLFNLLTVLMTVDV